jgi:hypothetical protein
MMNFNTHNLESREFSLPGSLVLVVETSVPTTFPTDNKDFVLDLNDLLMTVQPLY